MKDETLLVTSGRKSEENFGIVNPPVYHASTILFPTVERLEASRKPGFQGFLYGRYGTPTTSAFEDAVAALDGADRAIGVPSGLAAITVALLAHLGAGDHLLMPDNVYGPARNFAEAMLVRLGVETTFYEPRLGARVAELIRPETKAIYTESPGSHTFEIQDIPAIATAAHAAGVKVIMDNTWASPLFFKPYDHGVDVTVYAATKYLVGHSDAMLGIVTAPEANFAAIRSTARTLGMCAGPDDVYLGLRGLRTLSVRLRQHQENGLALARWLGKRPQVRRVIHPALPEDPEHDLWKRDFTGASGLFAVVLEPCSKESHDAFLDSLRLFGMGYSWGGYESLIVPTNPVRTATRWDEPGRLVRIHAGLEDAGDLIADLEQGLARLVPE